MHNFFWRWLGDLLAPVAGRVQSGQGEWCPVSSLCHDFLQLMQKNTMKTNAIYNMDKYVFNICTNTLCFPIRARGVMPCLPCMAACLTEGQSTQGGEDRWRGRGVEGHWGLASTTERHTNEPCGVGAGEHDAKNSIGLSLAGYNQPFGQCSPARVPCVSVVKSPWPVLDDGVEARETPGQISLLDREVGADPATSIYHPPLLACIHQI